MGRADTGAQPAQGGNGHRPRHLAPAIPLGVPVSGAKRIPNSSEAEARGARKHVGRGSTPGERLAQHTTPGGCLQSSLRARGAPRRASGSGAGRPCVPERAAGAATASGDLLQPCLCLMTSQGREAGLQPRSAEGCFHL